MLVKSDTLKHTLTHTERENRSINNATFTSTNWLAYHSNQNKTTMEINEYENFVTVSVTGYSHSELLAI